MWRHSYTFSFSETRMRDSAIMAGQSGHGLRLGKVAAAMVFFYVAALLLNAESFRRGAELMQYGWKRDVALALASPVAEMSRALRLDRPRALIERTAETVGRYLRKD